MNRFQRRSGCDFSCDCRCSVTADTDGHWSSGQGKITQRVVRDRKELANATIKLNMHVPGAETRITLLQTVFTLTQRAENVERLVIWQACVDLLSPRPRVRRAREMAKVRMLPRLVGIVVRVDTCRRNAPRRRRRSPCGGIVHHCESGQQLGQKSWFDRSESTSMFAA